jgi:hypothetical protein
MIHDAATTPVIDDADVAADAADTATVNVTDTATAKAATTTDYLCPCHHAYDRPDLCDCIEGYN